MVAADSARALVHLATACEQEVEEGLFAQPPTQAFGDDSDDSGASAAEPADEPARPALPRKAVVLGALGTALVLVCVAAGTGLWTRSSGPQTGNVKEEVGLGAFSSMMEFGGEMADGLNQVSELSESVRKSYGSLHHVMHELNVSALDPADKESIFHLFANSAEKRKELMHKFRALNQTQKEKIKKRLMKKFNITSLKQLKPHANLHDGNNCADDEEEYAHLCYKKCSLLTANHFPHRASAWQCCKHEPPCEEDYRISIHICGGFDVAGKSQGGGCPHTEGSCLKNEELYGNLCYKRCDMLTFGVMPVRAGPSTCCKPGDHSFLSFLDFGDCDTQHDFFQAGAGAGDEHKTWSMPHPPMPSLTES